MSSSTSDGSTIFAAKSTLRFVLELERASKGAVERLAQAPLHLRGLVVAHMADDGQFLHDKSRELLACKPHWLKNVYPITLTTISSGQSHRRE